MADGKGDADAKHEKALDKAEAALVALAEGDQKRAEKLVAEADKLDPTAAAEVARDLEEDAGSDPKAAEKL